MFKDNGKLTNIPIVLIKPCRDQPRIYFSETELNELAQSIMQNGILQPLSVRKVGLNEYELISGERRLRAAVLAGLSKVPCIIVNCSQKEAALLSIIENVQRADLNFFEEARAMKKLIIVYGLTQEQTAEKLGKKQSTVANKLRLLKLTDEEQNWIIVHDLSERHARALIKLDDVEERKIVLGKIISQNLSVTQTELLIDKLLEKYDNKKATKKLVVKDVRIFLNTINKAIDTMRLSGIDASAVKSETEEYIEYSVKIPKTNAFISKTA